MKLSARTNLFVFLIVSIALLAFDSYKAFHASFTHDESYTYLQYVNQTIADIFSYEGDLANNHLLNTLLMKWSAFFFGNTELPLRLPNILAHLLYLIVTYALFRRYTPKWTIPFFLIANFNPYLIDFFSLARGYGLAIACMTAGIYYYCRYIESKRTFHHVLSLVCIGLATLSNFALVNLVPIIVFIHVLFYFIIECNSFTFRNFLKANWVQFIVLIPFLVLIYHPIKSLIDNDLIIVGGNASFWNDTVTSLLYAIAYTASYKYIFVLLWQGLILGVATFTVIQFISIRKNKIPLELNMKIRLFLGLLLFLLVLSTILQHWLLETPYLMNRFALFLYPLFILLTCFLLITHPIFSNRICSIVVSVFIGINCLHTINVMNVRYYSDWKIDRDIKEMITRIDNHRKSRDLTNVSVGLSWEFLPNVIYYKQLNQLNWIIRLDGNGMKLPNDYYFVVNQDFKKINFKGNNISYDSFLHFAATDNYILRGTINKFVELQTKNGVPISLNKQTTIIEAIPQIRGERLHLSRIEKTKCGFLASNNLFLCTELNNTFEIIANRESIGEWETFEIIHSKGGLLAFKAVNGRFLSVDQQTHQIRAIGETIGEDELFRMKSIE